jgi:hypothetical protein
MLNNEIEKKKQSKKKGIKYERRKKLRVEIEKKNKFKNYRK